MPRPLHEDRPRKLTINVPTSVLSRVELLLIDPITHKPKYGSIGDLVSSLLREWIRQNTVQNSVITTGETPKEQQHGN